MAQRKVKERLDCSVKLPSPSECSFPTRRKRDKTEKRAVDKRKRDGKMNWKRARRNPAGKSWAWPCMENWLLKPPSLGQKAEVMQSRAGFKVTLSSGHNLLPIFGPSLLLLRAYGRNFKMMKKVIWNVHWLQLGVIGAIWNWAEQEVRGFKHHRALCELFLVSPRA